PFARDQWRAHADFVEESLSDAFLRGDAPRAADIHAYMNFWWVKAAIPHVAPSLLSPLPKVAAWMERMAALGHGKPTPMDAKDALAAAKAASSDAMPGAEAGTKVTVSADDYGRDPVAGEIVFADAHEIAIKRRDDQVGEVVVHFPRAGFTVVRT